MKNLLKVCALCLLLVIGSISSTFAWSKQGHMVIASLCWQQLSPSTQKKVSIILNHHPNHAEWKKWFDQYGAGIPEDEFMFMCASKWPDDIKMKNFPYQGTTNSFWHYTNGRVDFIHGHDAHYRPKKGKDIYNGIEYAKKQVHSSNLNDKAIAVCWMSHLVEDIHQPLHAASNYQGPFAQSASGDKGGNDFYIKTKATNKTSYRLHSYWDQLLGRSQNQQKAIQTALKIKKDMEGQRPSGNMNPVQWQTESFNCAVKYAYWNNQLPASRTAEGAAVLPVDYGKTAKKVAYQRAYAAANRLAIWLKQNIDEANM